MPSPFPGMDPFLESPAFWADFQASFITYLADALNDALPESYEARIDERTLFTEIRAQHIVSEKNPVVIEDETRENWINILHRPERNRVAVLELLSPANKEEPGRTVFLANHNALLLHPIHLITLDLLTGGRRLPLKESYPPGDYFALIARGDDRPNCKVYAWTVRQPLPALPIPLVPPDPDFWIDLGAVFRTAYERGRYARSIDYDAPPPIPARAEAYRWVVEHARNRPR